MNQHLSALIILGMFVTTLLPMTSANPFLINIRSGSISPTRTPGQSSDPDVQQVLVTVEIDNHFPVVKTVVVTITLHDVRETLLGRVASTVSLQPQQTSVITVPPFTVPPHAPNGPAHADINIYTTWRQAGGVAYCPKHQIPFTIQNSFGLRTHSNLESGATRSQDHSRLSTDPPHTQRHAIQGQRTAVMSTVVPPRTASAPELHGGFVETCEIFDPQLWDHFYSPPVAVGDGTWLFEFPAGQARTYNAVWREYTHYGTYTLRFKVSWRRPLRGLRWYSMFLFGQSLNEVDIPEMLSWGNTGPQTSSIAIHPYDAEGNKILNPNEPDGKWYWIFESTVDYEDGNWHLWETTYTPTSIAFTIDGVPQYTVTNHQDTMWGVSGFNWFPTIGDMQLIVGGGFDGSQTTTHRLLVDEITYTPLPTS
jgi:hypothetical protein